MIVEFKQACCQERRQQGAAGPMGCRPFPPEHGWQPPCGRGPGLSCQLASQPAWLQQKRWWTYERVHNVLVKEAHNQATSYCAKNSYKKAITHAKCSLSLLVSPLRVPAPWAQSLLTSAGDGWGCNLCLGLFILQDSCQRTAGGRWKLDKIGHISHLNCLSLLLFLSVFTHPVSLSLSLSLPLLISPPPRCAPPLTSQISVVGATCVHIASSLRLYPSHHLILGSLSGCITSSSRQSRRGWGEAAPLFHCDKVVSEAYLNDPAERLWSCCSCLRLHQWYWNTEATPPLPRWIITRLLLTQCDTFGPVYLTVKKKEKKRKKELGLTCN